MDTQIVKKEKFTFFKSLMNTQNLIHHKKELAKYNKISRSFTDLSQATSLKTFNTYNPSTVYKKNIEHNQTHKILRQGQYQQKLKNFRQRQERNTKILDKLLQISESSPTFDKLVRKSPDLHRISVSQRNTKYRSIDNQNVNIGNLILSVKSNYSLTNLNKNRHYYSLLQKRRQKLDQSKEKSKILYQNTNASKENIESLTTFRQNQFHNFFSTYQNQQDTNFNGKTTAQKMNHIIQNSERCIQSLKNTNHTFKQKSSKFKNHVLMSQKLRKQKLAINMIKSKNAKQILIKSKILKDSK